ncbi:MAG: TIGR03089 family protein [Nocardioidaceae bacterium]
MTTFESSLSRAQRADAARPLVTFYDEATGERAELSVTTYANWVAKTANLITGELDLGRGDRVRVDLPTHWLGAVWLGAVLVTGLEIVPEAAGADLVVCGPDGVEEYAGGAYAVVALSLRPLGARFAEPLPQGVLDFGVEVFGQPDVLFVSDPPAPGEAAFAGLSQEALLADASAIGVGGTRVLTDRNPATPEGAATLLGPLQHGGGVVYLVNAATDEVWTRRADQERATRV